MVSHDELRELAPELALGIVEGEERDRALEHLAGCPDCRRRVEELSDVADGLLLLAPHAEVPVGFEDRALSHLRPDRPPKPRRRLFRVLAPAAAALAAVAVTLAVVSDDLRTASQYRDTLEVANGSRFEAYTLRDGDSAVGTAFAYDGSPSWLFVTVDPGHRDLVRAELVLDDGSRTPLPWFHVTPGDGGSGGTVRADLDRVQVARLLPRTGARPLVARFGD